MSNKKTGDFDRRTEKCIKYSVSKCFATENDFIHPWNTVHSGLCPRCMNRHRVVLKVISMNRLLRPQAHDLNMRVTDISIARNLSVNIFPFLSIHLAKLCVFNVSMQ